MPEHTNNVARSEGTHLFFGAIETAHPFNHPLVAEGETDHGPTRPLRSSSHGDHGDQPSEEEETYFIGLNLEHRKVTDSGSGRTPVLSAHEDQAKALSREQLCHPSLTLSDKVSRRSFEDSDKLFAFELEHHPGYTVTWKGKPAATLKPMTLYDTTNGSIHCGYTAWYAPGVMDRRTERWFQDWCRGQSTDWGVKTFSERLANQAALSRVEIVHSNWSKYGPRLLQKRFDRGTDFKLIEGISKSVFKADEAGGSQGTVMEGRDMTLG